MRAALGVGHRFAELLSFGIEQAKLDAGERLTGHEREKVERDSAGIAFPDRADVG